MQAGSSGTPWPCTHRMLHYTHAYINITTLKNLLVMVLFKFRCLNLLGFANGRRSDVMTSLRFTAMVVIDNEAFDHVRNHHAVWQPFPLGLHC